MSKPLSLERAEIKLEPQPGTALKSVVQENLFLDEFMTVMRKRIELDAQHLANLKQLQGSYNPNWKNSSIWSLISPLIDLCGNEIGHLESHLSEATACLDRIPHSSSPLPDDKQGFNGFDMPENIKSPYLEYLRCYELASSESSVRDLKEYRQAFSRQKITQPLPEKERAYRQAVVQQQQNAELASRWYQHTFPEILENHQQRAEDVKNILYRILTSQSLFASRLSSSSSTAIHDIILFSSSKFIASHDEQINQEKGHTLLQKTCYRNHTVDGKVVKPLFGTGIVNAVALAHDILRKLESAGFAPPGFVRTCPREPMQLEQCIYDSGIAVIQQPYVLLWRTFELTFMTAPPFLPLSSEEISLYSKGLIREKMGAFLKTRVPVARQSIMSLFKSFVDHDLRYYDSIAAHLYLTGNRGTENLIRDLWREWDIEEDRPFPNGVERVWNKAQKHSEVVWKQTGEEYHGPQPDKAKFTVGDASSL